MILRELKAALRQNPEHRLTIIFPDGDPIEPDFHVTEVGYVTKNFIDCGGTKRSSSACVLQTWIAANDKEHRPLAGKLAKILDLAGDLVPSDDLPVEIEYEGCNIVQYPVVQLASSDGEIRLSLGKKHTDCLAKEACGLESACGPGTDCG
jgi:Family of unknown function (DUF6428)